MTGGVKVTVRKSASVPSQDPPVLRRKFIIGLGSLVALPVLPESGRLGMRDIEHIHDTETQLLRLDDQYGSEQLAGVAAHTSDTSSRPCGNAATAAVSRPGCTTRSATCAP